MLSSNTYYDKYELKYIEGYGFIRAIKFYNQFSGHNAIMCYCDFDRSLYADHLYDAFNIKFPNRFINAVVKRRAEYLAGRFVAISALSKLGREMTDIAIGEQGNPAFPCGVVGSISHNNTSAVALLRNNNHIKYIGIDLEHVIAWENIKNIQPIVVDEIEVQLLNSCGMRFNRAFTLAFSAKESLFKALYPFVNRYFDFFAARIVSIDVELELFTLKLNQDLTPIFPAGSYICGGYRFNENSLITFIMN
jgi:4'-phosphopantetheinyl transferase EntD